MKTTITQLFATLTLAAALSGVSATALADGAKIEFRDLDLTKPEGAVDLYGRIERSARIVCTDSLSPWDAQRVLTFQRCYTATIEAAVAKINAPRLNALHREKTRPVLVGAREN